MSFNITIKKDEKENFRLIMALYPAFNYAQVGESNDTVTLNILGEGIEEDCNIQELFMDRLSYANIEEEIGG